MHKEPINGKKSLIKTTGETREKEANAMYKESVSQLDIKVLLHL